MELGERLRGWARPIYGQFSKNTKEQVEQVSESAAPVSDQDSVLFADLLLQDAVRGRASDIHLEPDSNGIRVRFRIDGVLLLSLIHI